MIPIRSAWLYAFALVFTGIYSQTGVNGSFTVTAINQVVNKYCPVAANISASSATVAVTNSAQISACPGDLIMVYQAQGAAINTTNTSAYGDITAYNSSGLYEFKYVQSVSGNTITTQTSFTNSYATAGRVQVIKVPQYTNLTINSGASISAKAWKDTTISSTLYRFGGLVVIHASNITNNGIITASGAGFRGGALFSNSSIYTGATSNVSTLTTQGGEKGEGVFGFYAEYDVNGGRYCMGAPANGGGGGNNHNAGGGGGSNGNNGNTWDGQGVMIVDINNPLSAWSLSSAYITNSNALTNSSGGGHGGYSWGNTNANALTQGPNNSANWSGDGRREVGGIGGRPLTNINAESQIYFGGGGGAPEINNNSSSPGSNGGGIVYLIATTGITGTGTITVAGASAGNASVCSCDGAPGAGAGGSIIIKTGAIVASQNINANGGNGGNQFALTSPGNPIAESEGPGGGGGGGFVAISSSGTTPSLIGGLNGTSLSGAVTEFISNGATQGATGQTGTVSASFVSYVGIPGLLPGNNGPICPGLTLNLTTTVSGASYNWSGPNSFTSAVQNPVFANAIPSMSGIYSVTVTFTNSCQSFGTTTVNVFTQPTLTANSSNTLICNTTSVVLTAGGANSYTWQPGSLTAQTITLTPFSTIVYTLTGINTNSCTNSVSITQSVNPSPTLIAVPNGSICSGNTVTLNISGANTFTWQPINLTGSVITDSPPATTIYTITGTHPNGCTSSITTQQIVNITPTISIAANNTLICAGSTATLTASGANNYTWNPTGLSSTIFTVNPTVASSYTATGTSAAGCTASTISTISIQPSPTLSFTTFSITCGSLGSATVTSTGGVGSFSYSWIPTAQTNSIVGGLYPGNYTITVSDAGTGCVLMPTTNFAALVPLTGTVSATNSILCYGLTTGTASIQLSGGSNSQSYLWSNTISTITAVTATNLSAGVTTINVIDALTFCSVTHTFFISQPPALSLTIIGTPSVCLGGSITFTGNASGGTPGYTYTWTASPQDSIFSVTETGTGIYTYSVAGNDANNCLITKTVSATFVNNPVVSIPSVSICPLAIGSLLATGANSYSWSTGYTGNPLIVSPLVTTTYTVIGSALGCTAVASGSLILKSPPTASFTGNTSVCQGGSLQLSGLGSSLSYSWTGPLNFSSTFQNTLIASATPSQSGNYSLKVTAPNSCTASITKSLTVYPTPALSVSGSTICQGQTLHLYASYLPGATYLWAGTVNTSTIQNPGFTTSAPAMSGQYTATITTAAGCSNTAITQASVIASPVPVITTNTNYCVGSSIVLNGSGGNLLNWFGPNGFNSSLPSPTLTNVNTIASGIYSLYAYIASCYVSATVAIIVHALPVATASNSSPVCENSSFTLNSLSSAVGYTWTGPGNYTSNSSDPVINSALLNQNGIYTLSIADLNNCIGSAITSVSVIQAPLPIVQNETVCLGGSVTLTVSGGASYSWAGPANYISNFSFAFIPTVNVNNTGIYTVAVTGSNSCISSATVQVTGMPYAMPTPSISSLREVCLNSKIDLHGSGGITFFWLGPQSFTSSVKDPILNIINFNMGGTYTLSVSNESNCVASATISIKVNPLPQAVLNGNPNNLCVPFCTELKLEELQGSTPIKSYMYSINQKTFTSISQKHCFTYAGQYLVNMSFKDTNNCVNNATLVINAYPKPYADFQYSPLKPLAGIDEVLFYNSSTDNGSEVWNWFLTGTDSVTSTYKNTAYLFEKAGIYPIVLLTKNKWGCIDTLIKVIEVYDELSIYVPNVFTPNRDGLNDIFEPKGVGILKYQLEIFSRWGELIFETADFSHGWDGNFKGKECKTDAYAWRIYITDISGKTKTYTGHVSLLRAKIIEEDN